MTGTKYGNKTCVVDDIQFDSMKEAKRYCELKILQKAGEISSLQMQVPFELIPKQKLSNGKTERNCVYYADFAYNVKGKHVVEDVKGAKTKDYVIKRKLMKRVFDIEVVEL